MCVMGYKVKFISLEVMVKYILVVMFKVKFINVYSFGLKYIDVECLILNFIDFIGFCLFNLKFEYSVKDFWMVYK